MTTATATQIDESKLNSIIGQAVSDFGGTASAALVVIGDKLGLYKALRAAGPATPEDLAARTGTSERYLRHWLLNQAASGYVNYSAATGKYSLSPEQAAVFARSADRPARARRRFQQHHAHPALLKSPRAGEAGDTTARDDHVGIDAA